MGIQDNYSTIISLYSAEAERFYKEQQIYLVFNTVGLAGFASGYEHFVKDAISLAIIIIGALVAVNAITLIIGILGVKSLDGIVDVVNKAEEDDIGDEIKTKILETFLSSVPSYYRMNIRSRLAVGVTFTFLIFWLAVLIYMVAKI